MQDIYDIPKQSKDDISSLSYDDITTVESMKRDLKKVKRLLLSIGLLLAIFLTVSLTAAVVAVLAYSKPASAGSQVSRSDVQNIASSELLRILNETAPDQKEKIDLLQQMFIRNLSFQLEKLYVFQTNLSLINEQVGAMKGRLGGLDLLLNTNLDTVREELVSLSNITEITSTRRDITELRTEISELRTSFNGDTSSLMVRLNALDSHVTTNYTSLTNQISSLQLSSNRTITSVISDIATLRRDVSSLQISTTNSINSVTTQINTLSGTHSRDNSSLSSQITTLQQQTDASIDTVTSRINTLSTTHTNDNSLLTNRVSGLQSTTTSLSGSISTINTRLSRPVNIYQGCYNITRSCTLSAGAGAGAEHIKPYCQTTYLNINRSVSLLLLNHNLDYLIVLVLMVAIIKI